MCSQKLEGEFVIPNRISRKTEFSEEDQQICYRLTAYDIRYKGDFISAYYTLSKFLGKQGNPQRKLKSLIPYRTEMVPGEIKWMLIWQIGNHSLRENFISCGRLKFDRYTAIKADIVGKLAEINVLMSDQLLNDILRPMQEGMLEIWHIINDFPPSNIGK